MNTTKKPPVTGIAQLVGSHNRKERRYKNSQARLEAVKARLQKLKGPYWVKTIIEPLAKAIAERLGCDFDVLGPFGLCCEVAVHFGPNCKHGALRFRTTTHPGDDQLGVALVDYAVNTGRYSPNSIGAINGMNHPIIDIPEDADLDWFIDQLRQEE